LSNYGRCVRGAGKCRCLKVWGGPEGRIGYAKGDSFAGEQRGRFGGRRFRGQEDRVIEPDVGSKTKRAG